MIYNYPKNCANLDLFLDAIVDGRSFSRIRYVELTKQLRICCIIIGALEYNDILSARRNLHKTQ